MKITVLICTYGRYNLLTRAVNCFLAQTHQEKELIIFNTHPVDINCELPNVTVINSKDNFKTLGEIRKKAFKFVPKETDYIAFWDDDDIMFPDLLEKLITKAVQYNLSLIKPKNIYQYTNGKVKLLKCKCEPSCLIKYSPDLRFNIELNTGEHQWYRDLPINEFNNNSPLFVIDSSKAGHITLQTLEYFRKWNNDSGGGKPIESIDINSIYKQIINLI